MSAPAAVVFDVYSHNVHVTQFSGQIKGHLIDFCRMNASWKLERVGRAYVKRMKDVYADTTRTRNEFRFHRNQLHELINFLRGRGIPEAQIQVNHRPMYRPKAVDLKFIDPRPPREEQIPLLEYLRVPPAEGLAPSKVVTLQTGKGKGYISIKTVCESGARILVILMPRFIEKWIKELQELTDIKASEMMVLAPKITEGSGKGLMQGLLNAAVEDRLGDTKVIVISNVVFANYLDAYTEQMGFDFPVAPGDFCEALGIGIRLIDEVHMDFYRNFRVDLYSHVPYTLALSATLDGDDPFINSRYRIMWPREAMPPEVQYDAFIGVRSLYYRIMAPHLIRCQGFAKSYNHLKFEESILRSKRMTTNYLDMIGDIVKRSFVEDNYVPGQSAIVFCSTIKMCTLVTAHLASLWGHLKVKRYVGGDSFKNNFLDSDIVVSTVGSAGTAVDKPNLRETIMTVALNSKQANIQVLGRTRRLKDYPDVVPRFTFLSAVDIPKHMEYAKAKEPKFKGKVASFITLHTDYRV